MFRFQWLAILCLLAFFQKGANSNSACSKDDESCEFWLEISNRLTMMQGHDAVYPFNGKLFKYDVPEEKTNETADIDPNEVIVADGWEVQKLVIVANGTMPGPPIEVYENQKIIVHVTNRLSSDGVTIHWHGLHQRGTPWMDGVALLTQCPIEPGQTFTYRFTASPKGTFWYHSHIGAQMGMGLIGAFIIRERKELEMPEHIMMIQDWNHDWVSEVIINRVEFGSFMNRMRVPTSVSLEGGHLSAFPFHSGLINGRGRYFGNTNTSNMAPLTVYSVKKGESYRFRVVGAGTLYPFRISVDEHPLTLVASDGFELVPLEMESFVIQPGERFDFVIEANQTVDNYWIRGESLEIEVVNHIALAILRYEGANEEEPMSERKQCQANDRCKVGNCPYSYYPVESYTDCINFELFRSRENHITPGKDDEVEEVFLNLAFPGIDDFPGSVNGRVLKAPSSPPLTQPDMFTTMCQDKDDCGEQKICHCALSLNLELNKSYQMVLLNLGVGRGWAHPIHMHGHSFYVVKMGYPPYNTTTGVVLGDTPDVDCGGNVSDPKDSFCNKASWANSDWGGNSVPGLELESPPLKDTITVPTGGYVVIRIRADNPGVWFMHCHIELHAEIGMALILNESFPDHLPPPNGFPKCGNFDYNLEGNHSDSDDCDDDEEIYWGVIGALGGIILFQLLLNVYFIRRNSSPKSSSASGASNSDDKPSYVNHGFTS